MGGFSLLECSVSSQKAHPDQPFGVNSVGPSKPRNKIPKQDPMQPKKENWGKISQRHPDKGDDENQGPTQLPTARTAGAPNVPGQFGQLPYACQPGLRLLEFEGFVGFRLR